MNNLRMSNEWVDRISEIMAKRPGTSVTHDLLAELISERERYDTLRAQFIKHRTATHKVNPHECETCLESDVVLGVRP